MGDGGHGTRVFSVVPGYAGIRQPSERFHRETSDENGFLFPLMQLSVSDSVLAIKKCVCVCVRVCVCVCRATPFDLAVTL